MNIRTEPAPPVSVKMPSATACRVPAARSAVADTREASVKTLIDHLLFGEPVARVVENGPSPMTTHELNGTRRAGAGPAPPRSRRLMERVLEDTSRKIGEHERRGDRDRRRRRGEPGHQRVTAV